MTDPHGPPVPSPGRGGRDADEIDALLDVAPRTRSPARDTAASRPGWASAPAGLVAVGALLRQPDGTGHLRAVTVLPECADVGSAAAVGAALTRARFDGGSGVATLGVYVDNAPAVAIYRRLGYEVAHTFASGPVRDDATRCLAQREAHHDRGRAVAVVARRRSISTKPRAA